MKKHVEKDMGRGELDSAEKQVASDVATPAVAGEPNITAASPSPWEPLSPLGTILFTDIVNSSGKKLETGDRQWKVLLAAHDALVRTAIEIYGGNVIKHTGDGFVLVFRQPSTAIQCATSVRDGLRYINMESCLGIHMGEYEVKEDGDITGTVVDTTSRVMDEAEPSEILVTESIRLAVAGSGFQFFAPKERDLKGIGRGLLYPLSRGAAGASPAVRASSASPARPLAAAADERVVETITELYKRLVHAEQAFNAAMVPYREGSTEEEIRLERERDESAAVAAGNAFFDYFASNRIWLDEQLADKVQSLAQVLRKGWWQYSSPDEEPGRAWEKRDAWRRVATEAPKIRAEIENAMRLRLGVAPPEPEFDDGYDYKRPVGFTEPLLIREARQRVLGTHALTKLSTDWQGSDELSLGLQRLLLTWSPTGADVEQLRRNGWSDAEIGVWRYPYSYDVTGETVAGLERLRADGLARV